MTRHERGITERLARAGVTDREAEVLLAVAERLRNREIADRLHVSVRTVESHIAALLRKLAVADRAALAQIGVEVRGVARADAGLPAPLTSLVGRDSETSEILALLDGRRLVTLTGPGGVGKTRLALRVATGCADRFSDGVRLADLAPVDAELVGETFARALSVAVRPGWSVRDILREVAGGMDCLLLVDNCEHVIASVADIVADLLTAGGRLRVLATSREPLGVPGEASYPVATLPVPDRSASSAAAVGRFDAVRLFVDRASNAAAGFTLTDTNAPAVATLCQRLDGLPLAIELAASRTHTFGPAELVRHLGQRFDLLSAGARTVLPRQRTLRAAIGWSYDLLDAAEQTLFDRLGVFPADFDYDAVEAVSQAHDPGGVPVLALLPRLVDKSLVSPIGHRYRLLESIRAFAVERLAASGAEAGARHAHAAHYLAVAEDGAERLRGTDQRAWLERLAAEQPNLRAALEFSISSGDIESAWRWIAALQRLWDITGQRPEAHDWIRRALAIGDPPATGVVVAGLAAASAILQPSDAAAAFELGQQASQLAAGLDDFSRATAALAVGMGAIWVKPELVQPALHEALAGFGDEHPWHRALTMQVLARTSGELSAALGWARDSVALFRDVGDHMCAANTLFIMAQLAMHAGKADEQVHDWLIESQALPDAAGSDDDRMHATVGFGQLAWLRGDHVDAARLMEECLPTLRRLGDLRCTGRALHLLGEYARQGGELALAEERLRASVEAITRAGQSIILTSALEALAAVVDAQGRPRSAAVLLATAHTTRTSASPHARPMPPPNDDLYQSLLEALGTEAFHAAYRTGEHLSPTQALHLIAADPEEPAARA